MLTEEQLDERTDFITRGENGMSATPVGPLRLAETPVKPRPLLPEFLTLRDRLARPPLEQPWRIAHLQRSGHRVVLVAPYKSGKTTMIGNLLRSLVDGDPFLGCPVTPIQSGTVAVLDWEMQPQQLDEWHRAQGIVHDDRIWSLAMRGVAFNLLDPVVRAAWATELAARTVKYLIIDCLRPVLDSCGLNEHAEIGRFLTNGLDPLLLAAHIDEVLIVHHAGHDSTRARGDSRLADWPDGIWTLSGNHEHPTAARHFRATGRDVQMSKVALAYDPNTRRLSPQSVLGPTLDAIVKLLQETPGLTSDAIETKLAGEHPRARVRQALNLGKARHGMLRSTKGAKGANCWGLP